MTGDVKIGGLQNEIEVVPERDDQHDVKPSEAMNGDSSESEVLRRLATRALGLSGADIERVVREARLKARREKRRLAYADIEAGIRGHRPPVPYDVRWRLAIHESGHAVVHHALRLGQVRGLTIDSKEGGHNSLAFVATTSDTEDWYRRLLAQQSIRPSIFQIHLQL